MTDILKLQKKESKKIQQKKKTIYFKGEYMIELYNGDCLEVMDELIEKGIKVNAIITDPPYGKTC